MSCNCYHTGCWPELSACEYRNLKEALPRLYRLVMPKEPDVWASDDAVLQETGMMHPVVLVRSLRLCTAIRLFRTNSAIFWGLLLASRAHPRSWIRAVEIDIGCLADCGAQFAEVDSPSAFFILACSRHKMLVVRDSEGVQYAGCSQQGDRFANPRR